MTFDYYKNVLGRNGIFGNGTGAPSRVHYGNNYVNAFWDGTKMTYGDGDGTTFGPLVSLDVAGHEMSHGVTENTANLTYSGESGGLNEATSDIFGTMVEFYAANASDPGDYYIGEEFDRAQGVGFRRMDNPISDGSSPNCYSADTKNLDVHYSSGVANHFFYLLAEGSGAKTIGGKAHSSTTCNGSTSTGIGRDAAQKIWFRALTTYFTSGTTYAQARTATLSAAATSTAPAPSTTPSPPRGARSRRLSHPDREGPCRTEPARALSPSPTGSAGLTGSDQGGVQADLLDGARPAAVDVELAVGGVGGPAGPDEERPASVVAGDRPGDRPGEPVGLQGLGDGLQQPAAVALAAARPGSTTSSASSPSATGSQSGSVAGVGDGEADDPVALQGHEHPVAGVGGAASEARQASATGAASSGTDPAGSTSAYCSLQARTCTRGDRRRRRRPRRRVPRRRRWVRGSSPSHHADHRSRPWTS